TPRAWPGRGAWRAGRSGRGPAGARRRGRGVRLATPRRAGRPRPALASWSRVYCLDIEINSSVSIISMSTDISDPDTYARYGDERSRPFHDLLARVRAESPAYVVDAGCGSGELTAVLARRWPQAEILGFDSSPAMIAKARELDAGVRFAVADVTTWHPDRPVDVIVSNAVLQWVPEHSKVVERW